LIFLGIALKRNKFAHKVLVYTHNGRIVVEVSTVVLGAKDSDQLLVFSEEAVAVLHHLMASADQVKVVFFEELLQLRLAKHVSAASLVLLPVPCILVGVIPEQVRYKATVRHVCWLVDGLNLLEGVHVFRDAAVHAHDFLVDKGHQGHVVEATPESLPEMDFVPSLDLVEKPVDSRDGLRLVISSQNDNLLRVSNF